MRTPSVSSIGKALSLSSAKQPSSFGFAVAAHSKALAVDGDVPLPLEHRTEADVAGLEGGLEASSRGGRGPCGLTPIRKPLEGR